MLELTVIFAFAAMLSWGVGDFLIQKTIRKIGALDTLAWICIFSSIILLPFVAKDLARLTQTDLIFLAVLGIIAFLSAMLGFEALHHGKLSVINIVLTIELPITIVLSMIFLKETLTLVQVILMLVTISGMLLISFTTLKNWNKNIEKGVLLAIGSGLLIGIINFMTAKASRSISPEMSIWAPWLVVVMISLVVISRGNGLTAFFNKGMKLKNLLFWACLIDTGAWLFYAWAVKEGQVSIVTAITESHPAVAMFLGVMLNKESIKPHQYIGAVLALIGSIILATMI
jgi:drug/metabolite transporter (DMT)-like permease